jgi:hypothetical protein
MGVELNKVGMAVIVSVSVPFSWSKPLESQAARV